MRHRLNKKLLEQDICETVSGLPVNIGAHALKLTAVTALASRYMKWTKGLTLTMDDVELRSEDWEMLIPKDDDVDAISARFYKKSPGRNNREPKLVFVSKLEHLVLALPYEKYEIALAHSVRDLDDDTLPVLATTGKVTQSLLL